MQLVVAMILHVRFFGVSGLIYSPIANYYTGPLYWIKTWKISLSDNPGILQARCLHDEAIANGRDIDDQRINLGKT